MAFPRMSDDARVALVTELLTQNMIVAATISALARRVLGFRAPIFPSALLNTGRVGYGHRCPYFFPATKLKLKASPVRKDGVDISTEPSSE
jgi:hypothetical protein